MRPPLSRDLRGSSRAHPRRAERFSRCPRGRHAGAGSHGCDTHAPLPRVSFRGATAELAQTPPTGAGRRCCRTATRGDAPQRTSAIRRGGQRGGDGAASWSVARREQWAAMALHAQVCMPIHADAALALSFQTMLDFSYRACLTPLTPCCTAARCTAIFRAPPPGMRWRERQRPCLPPRAPWAAADVRTCLAGCCPAPVPPAAAARVWRRAACALPGGGVSSISKTAVSELEVARGGVLDAKRQPAEHERAPRTAAAVDAARQSLERGAADAPPCARGCIRPPCTAATMMAGAGPRMNHE